MRDDISDVKSTMYIVYKLNASVYVNELIVYFLQFIQRLRITNILM